MTTETAQETTEQPTSKKGSQSAEPNRTRIGALMERKNPSAENVLLSIEGQEVEIVGIEISEERQGRRGKYKLAHITLSDGRTFTVAGSGVTTPLSYVEDHELPVFAVFSREPSDFEPGTYYWKVS